MALHTIRSVDHQNRIIQYLQGALHLCGKIHMPRCIQQRHFHISHGKNCLFGKNGNASFPFQFIRIQICIFMIHTSDLPDSSAFKKQPLR